MWKFKSFNFYYTRPDTQRSSEKKKMENKKKTRWNVDICQDSSIQKSTSQNHLPQTHKISAINYGSFMWQQKFPALKMQFDQIKNHEQLNLTSITIDSNVQYYCLTIVMSILLFIIIPKDTIDTHITEYNKIHLKVQNRWSGCAFSGYKYFNIIPNLFLLNYSRIELLFDLFIIPSSDMTSLLKRLKQQMLVYIRYTCTCVYMRIQRHQNIWNIIIYNTSNTFAIKIRRAGAIISPGTLCTLSVLYVFYF